MTIAPRPRTEAGTEAGSACGRGGRFALDDVASGALPLRDRLTPIMQGQCVGLVLRNALPRAIAKALVEAAEGGAFPSVEARYYQGRAYGPSLIVDGGPSEAYFAAAGSLSGFSSDGTDVEALMVRALSGLAGGQPLDRVEGRGGRRYAPLGIRTLEPGGSIHLHCENETRSFPAMVELSKQLSSDSILSFYVPLAEPEEGGDLEIYPLRFGEPSGEALTRVGRQGSVLDDLLRKVTPIVPRLAVGDLLIFDAGRHFHRVTRVGGSRTRWTFGGFLARATDGTQFRYWN
jgi:hypothetical protein